MKRLFGCTGIAILIAGVAAYALTQTQMGKWVGGLVLVYGGTMVAGVMAFSSADATVTKVERKDDAFFNGSIEFEWLGDDGVTRSARKQVMGRPGALDAYEVGQKIGISICRENPEVVRISGLQTFNKDECLTKTAKET